MSLECTADYLELKSVKARQIQKESFTSPFSEIQIEKPASGREPEHNYLKHFHSNVRKTLNMFTRYLLCLTVSGLPSKNGPAICVLCSSSDTCRLGILTFEI